MDAPFDLRTVDRLLTTTRAVRRRLDLARPVPREVLLECVRLSQQSPTASNSQSWRWLIVTDPEKRSRIGEIYGRGAPAVRDRLAGLEGQSRRVHEGALWLAENLGRVPVHVFACVEGRPAREFSSVASATLYGSILPAVWSFQLALRSRGLGSTFTTMHLLWEREIGELLGIPEDVLQVALLPVAWTRGTDFRPARRPPPESVTRFESWSGTA